MWTIGSARQLVYPGHPRHWRSELEEYPLYSERGSRLPREVITRLMSSFGFYSSVLLKVMKQSDPRLGSLICTRHHGHEQAPRSPVGWMA
jgi:hypothetical protein